jgi:hypothetical protein
MKVQGDERSYQLLLLNQTFIDDQFYYKGFITTKEWKVVRIPFEKFSIQREGDRLGSSNAVTFEKVAALGIGVEDYQVGKFQLKIEYIKLYNK